MSDEIAMTGHARSGKADVAAGRALAYGLFVSVLERRPDRALVERIKNGDLQGIFSRFCTLKDKGFRAGARAISSYESAIRKRTEEEVLEELSVDRTMILRGTGHPDLKPPYEGLYAKTTGLADSVLEVRRFYRKAGLVPDEEAGESADYLSVELDFMRQLCLREETLRRLDSDVSGLIALEEEFLKLHLGAWVGDFCRAVAKHGSTAFFRGFFFVLDAFSRAEKRWLRDLVRQKGSTREA